MKYDSNREQSAELLRQTLVWMAKQQTAMHPLSYAVWYEYVAGINPALKAELQPYIDRGQPLDEETTDRLFQRYVADIDRDSAARLGQRFDRMLGDISASANQTGGQISTFGDTLERLSGALEHPTETGSSFIRSFHELREGTRDVRSMLDQLQSQLISSQDEIENLRAEVDRTRTEAVTDSLTGLLNRKGMDEQLASLMAEATREGQGLSLLICDIDHFKAINDQFGHVFGDRVIRGVGQAIAQTIKNSDVAARYGGEEYVVLLPDTPLQGALVVAENIRRRVETIRIRRNDSEEVKARVTISLGATGWKPGESSADFIARADQALYQAKRGGRNRACSSP